MSRVYDTYCETRDSIYIAMGDAGLSEGLFKQLHNEQGRDAVAYVIDETIKSIKALRDWWLMI